MFNKFFFSQCIDISESTLYPILKRLENHSYVETYTVEHNGRLRKYYKLTANGQEHIQDFLSGWNQIENIYHYIEGELNHD